MVLFRGPGRAETADTVDRGCPDAAARETAERTDARRRGEIQGQMLWNWRLLSTPDRP